MVFPPRRTSRKASGGVLFFGGLSVPVEPSVKRTVAFVDGQNLFFAAKKAFGHRFPNYDPRPLLTRSLGAGVGRFDKPSSTREFPTGPTILSGIISGQPSWP